VAKKPLTSPSALYRIEKRLTPKAKAAFQAAVKQWQKDVAAGKPPNPNALKPLVKVTEDGTRLAGTAAAAQIAGVRPGIKLAFDLTNPQAVKWAKQNAARLIKDISSETRNAVKQAIARAVSGEMTTAQVGRYVREIVGLTERQEQGVFNFYERAIAAGFSDADALDEANGYAESLRRYRSEVIARSEVLRAENAGQELLWEQGVASGQLKGLERQWLATDDELTCPICGEMNGQTTPIGEPWKGPDGEEFATPQDSHPQCLPGYVRVMTESMGAVRGAIKRWFDGEVVILRVSAAQELRVTPNHPILTPSGWVAAGALHEGEEVICHSLDQWEALADDHDVDVPPTIQEVARAWVQARAVRPTPVPVAPEDFHGDGINSQVAVVWSDRSLRAHGQSTLGQHRKQGAFASADLGLIEPTTLAGQSQRAARGHRFGMTTDGLVRAAHLSGARPCGHAAPLDALSFGLSSRRQPEGAQAMRNDRPRHAVPLGEAQDRLASMEAFGQSDDGWALMMPNAVLSHGNVEPLQVGIQESRMRADFAGQRGDPFASHVTVHQLLYVNRAQFSGHVYNLETDRGWYVAEGIIAHNCRCSEGLVEAR